MPSNRPLPRDFYLQDTLVVARQLLGKELVHTGRQRTSGIIVEAEAYKGITDPAAHTFGGRRTERVRAMWGEGGHAYMFRIYGMHFCLNVVTREPGKPEAVLIRALEPRDGVELMRRRRHLGKDKPDRLLTNGPGKLCQAMAIDMSCYGADLCGRRLYITEASVPPFKITAAKRVGVDYAGEAKNWPWRFYITGNPFVSRP